jgi:hypothetical protein
MTLSELEGLAAAGRLKREPPNQAEFDGLVQLGEAKLQDSRTASLSLAGRFELAYGASHSFALAALRWHGYRSDQRYVDFQTAQETRQEQRGPRGPAGNLVEPASNTLRLDLKKERGLSNTSALPYPREL